MQFFTLENFLANVPGDKQAIQVVPQEAVLVSPKRDLQDKSLTSHIAQAAKVCTDKPAGSFEEDKEFVKKLMSWGHWSPFEFVDLTFKVRTSRAVSHELVRHRMASYMQESQRYCRYVHGLDVIQPTTLHGLGIPTWQQAVKSAYGAYLQLLESGVKAEDARTVLPTCTATNLLVKMNLREFRHFLSLRTSPAAWSQMRELALFMQGAFVREFPFEKFLVDEYHVEEHQ